MKGIVIKNTGSWYVVRQEDGSEVNCKIKGNLRFEKGIKTIECDIPGQRVTITYDAGKTNAEAIIQSFGKFGYKATEVKAEEQTGKTESSPKKDKDSK